MIELDQATNPDFALARAVFITAPHRDSPLLEDIRPDYHFHHAMRDGGAPRHFAHLTTEQGMTDITVMRSSRQGRHLP